MLQFYKDPTNKEPLTNAVRFRNGLMHIENISDEGLKAMEKLITNLEDPGTLMKAIGIE